LWALAALCVVAAFLLRRRKPADDKAKATPDRPKRRWRPQRSGKYVSPDTADSLRRLGVVALVVALAIAWSRPDTTVGATLRSSAEWLWETSQQIGNSANLG
jgi:hypothetical protein